jgi:hypothetical protein
MIGAARAGLGGVPSILFFLEPDGAHDFDGLADHAGASLRPLDAVGIFLNVGGGCTRQVEH